MAPSFTAISVCHHLSASDNRWSCCRYNVNNAWNFHGNGFANNNNFYNTWLRVSAVSAFVTNPIRYDMVREEDLYTVYELARANKRRSYDAVVFEIKLESNIAELCLRINECTFRAHGNYTFISPYPTPREIFGCEMGERVIQWYILWRITPILEKTLIDGLCSNRKGKGIDAAVNKVYHDILSVSRHYTRDAYVIQWDLQGYYPNADCDIACRQLQQLVIDHYEGDDKDSLLWMIMIAIHANPQAHYYRKCGIEMWDLIPYAKSILNKPAGKGGVIGYLIWQIAMNLYLNDSDHWIADDMELSYTRYADDCVMIVQNKEAALAMLPLIREKYAEVGCTMHPKKFYCQHVAKGLKFLGAHIRYERIYVDNRVVRKALSRVAEFNRCNNKMKHLQGFLSTLNSYFGRMKNRNEFNNIKRIWEAVDESWHKYATMDWDRLCVTPTEGYTYNEYILKRFKTITQWNITKKNSVLKRQPSKTRRQSTKVQSTTAMRR